MQPSVIELSIIVPTYNERDNVERVVAVLDAALAGVRWEVIFVDDDSPDETFRKVCSLAQRDARVRCIRRVGRRGLASACIEGMLASCAPFLAVMDADLQHDDSLLPLMLDALRSDAVDLVIGSRYAAGGSTGDWSAERKRMSLMASRLAKWALKTELTDPMSGFFMLRRRCFDRCVERLSGIGFKILLDILASAPEPVRILELPYRFRTRKFGESKLDPKVQLEFVWMLCDKTLGRFVPTRFIAFSVVGGIGILVHFVALWLLFKLYLLDFVVSQTGATLIAMTGNFALNNAFTYRDRRLRGWAWLRGWLSFVLICSVGAASNVGVAAYLFQTHEERWVLAALAGVLVGAVWNYAISSVFTWTAPGRMRS
jgi:dolichol-phosphate mannosyltransferase